MGGGPFPQLEELNPKCHCPEFRQETWAGAESADPAGRPWRKPSPSPNPEQRLAAPPRPPATNPLVPTARCLQLLTPRPAGGGVHGRDGLQDAGLALGAVRGAEHKRPQPLRPASPVPHSGPGGSAFPQPGAQPCRAGGPPVMAAQSRCVVNFRAVLTEPLGNAGTRTGIWTRHPLSIPTAPGDDRRVQRWLPMLASLLLFPSRNHTKAMRMTTQINRKPKEFLHVSRLGIWWCHCCGSGCSCGKV